MNPTQNCLNCNRPCHYRQGFKVGYCGSNKECNKLRSKMDIRKRRKDPEVKKREAEYMKEKRKDPKVRQREKEYREVYNPIYYKEIRKVRAQEKKLKEARYCKMCGGFLHKTNTLDICTLTEKCRLAHNRIIQYGRKKPRGYLYEILVRDNAVRGRCCDNKKHLCGEGRCYLRITEKCIARNGWWGLNEKIKTKQGWRPIIEVEHLKPVSRFPELRLEKSNMKAACRYCNVKKMNSVDKYIDISLLVVKEKV